jgi:hypothetical protein
MISRSLFKLREIQVLSEFKMATGNFSMGNCSPNPPPFGEILPVTHLRERFLPRSEPDEEREYDGDPHP